MTALAPDERRRYRELRTRISASVNETAATDISLSWRLDESLLLADVAEWMSLERRCCPFLNIALVLRADGTRWLEIGGSGRIKEFPCGVDPLLCGW